MSDPATLYNILRVLMKDPCLILMLGVWDSGKTDTSLLMGYLAKKWGLIGKIGSNIWTYENPGVEYITTLGKLKRWLWTDKLTKLFIFDEALSNLHQRNAMSKENKAIISIIAELSKAHGRMIFCSQTTDIESTLKDTAFLRATFTKLQKKVMVVRSGLFESETLYNIPRSPITFDRDRVAPFDLTEVVSFDNLSLEYKCSVSYANGASLSQISRELQIHKEEVKRNIRKVLKSMHTKDNLEIVNNCKQNVNKESDSN